MKVGDLVVFKGDYDRVPGLVVEERGTKGVCFGVRWVDNDETVFEPEEYLELINESCRGRFCDGR